jgi:uncharacterized protein
MQGLLNTLREEFKSKLKNFNLGTARDFHFAEIPNKIQVAIGVRRSGKTYFLFQKIIELLKEVPFSRILYLNFEDERLFPLGPKELGALIDNFYSLYPENHESECYLFLDEIQNVEGWPRVIRRIFDNKNAKIYLSGSSAKLLSKEIATSLRGRSIALEVWPFSFQEVMLAKNIEMPEKPFGRMTLDKLQEQLRLYIETGGFPETLFLNTSERTPILQDYVSVVVLRDIIERYKISNISLIRYMVKTLIKNVGCSFAVNKFHNDLKSQGFLVSKGTIHDYLSYMEDAYLVFPVPLYAESIKKTQSNPKKIYAVDTGMVRAYSLGVAQNIGHHFENLIYLDLRKKGHQVYYYLTKTRKEIDFLSLDLGGNWHLYQVCWDMNDPKTEERERAALLEAEKELNIKGVLVTPMSYFDNFLPKL